MKYRIEKYTPSHFTIWNDFVKSSANGTIFHEQQFISYHGTDKFNDSSLLIYEKDKLVALFPAALINFGDKVSLKSHPGTSYGGFVLSKFTGLGDCFEMINVLEQYCTTVNIRKIEFRHGPRIFHTYPSDQLDFALVKSGFYREAEELATCYKLSDYNGLSEYEFLNKFPNNGVGNPRRNIHKALQHGLTTRFFNDNQNIESFYSILEKNLTKHNTKPVHSIDEIKILLRLYPDRVRLFGVFEGDKLLSGFFTFVVNACGVHIFYSALDYAQQIKRPQSFGLFKLIQQISQEGYDYLNFGISTEKGGSVINEGLYKFKESFNGSGSVRTYWVKDL